MQASTPAAVQEREECIEERNTTGGHHDQNEDKAGLSSVTESNQRDLDVRFLLSFFAPTSTSSMHIPEVDIRRIGIMKEQQLRHATTVNPTGKTLMLLNVPAFLIPQDYLAFLGGCLRYIYIFICLFLIIGIKYPHSTLLNSTLFCFHC